ncbi:hypothetical protein [Saccharopolyspora sp. NPDC002578]
MPTPQRETPSSAAAVFANEEPELQELGDFLFARTSQPDSPALLIRPEPLR